MDQLASPLGGDASVLANLLTAAVWLVVGFLVGLGIRRLTVWLSEREKIEYGSRPWQVWGPPILNAVLFAAFAYRLGPSPLLILKSCLVAVFVQVIFFDFEHRLILDRVMFPAIAAAILFSFFTPGLGLVNSVLTGLVAGLLFLALALIGAALYGADALGFGDVKLVAFIGLVIGWTGFAIISALFLGVLFAGVVSILLVLLRIRTMKDAIPYGPFLSAGALVVLLEQGAK